MKLSWVTVTVKYIKASKPVIEISKTIFTLFMMTDTYMYTYIMKLLSMKICRKRLVYLFIYLFNAHLIEKFMRWKQITWAEISWRVFNEVWSKHLICFIHCSLRRKFVQSSVLNLRMIADFSFNSLTVYLALLFFLSICLISLYLLYLSIHSSIHLIYSLTYLFLSFSFF